MLPGGGSYCCVFLMFAVLVMVMVKEAVVRVARQLIPHWRSFTCWETGQLSEKVDLQGLPKLNFEGSRLPAKGI